MSWFINFINKLFCKSIGNNVFIRDDINIPLNIDFRYQDDETHIIRIKQNPPAGFGKKICKNVMLKKIYWASKVDYAISFIEGGNRKISLERSPKGIKVFGHWQGARKYRKAHIGWVPPEITNYIHQNYANQPLAATITKMFRPRDFMSPGIRYDIWIPD